MDLNRKVLVYKNGKQNSFLPSQKWLVIGKGARISYSIPNLNYREI